MFYKFLALCVAVYLSVNLVSAQNSTLQPSPTPTQDEVVRISTNLVQLDAVVVDKDGKQVSNLTANDFEIFQDGKLQAITQFSYVNTETNERTQNSRNEVNNQSQTSSNINPGGFGRVITFVVDDGNCLASQIGIAATREALEKFINEQMQPNDLVAIYQTRAGSILNQQYTSDKTQLRRIVSKIKWSPAAVCDTRGGDLFARENADYTVKASGTGKKTFESKIDRETREEFEDRIRENNALGNIEILRFITQRLKNVGGRKIIFFLSDGLSVVGRNNRILRSRELLRTLISEANQSSIVFNSIDIRGLFNASLLQANDEVLVEMPNTANPTSTDKAIINRITENRNSEDGLAILADETGGSFAKNRNQLDTSIRDLLNLEKGFYLLGYQPDEETFEGKKFHKIEIRLKRADLRVLSRSGFSVRETENNAVTKTSENGEILKALNSPLPLTGLNLRLDGFFSHSPKDGSAVYSILRLNGREITFVDGENGMKKAVLEITAVLFDEKGKPAGSFSRAHTISVSPQTVAAIQENGITFPFQMQVKKSGVYSLRVAVRDSSSRQIGSAGETVEVPDLQNGNLFFPVVALTAVDDKGNPVSSPKITNGNTSTVIESAIPRFRRGTNIAYIYTLYNAQIDKASKKPNLTIQISLFRSGQIFVETKPAPVELETKTDWTRLDSGNYLSLASSMPTGIYTLRVTIKDLSSGKTVEQWADFELTE